MNDDNIMAIVFGFGTFVLIVVAVLVVLAILAGNARAKAAVARDDAFRKLSENYESLLTRVTDSGETTAAELGQLRERTAEIERVLKTVE